MTTPSSDVDIKGIFLPSLRSLVLKEKRDQYGQYNYEETDLELWSIHKFFKLLQKGDTNAYDLLFALSNEDARMYKTNLIERIYWGRKELIGSKPIRKAFIGYAYGQYKRYEAKGFNFRTLKFILKYFKENEYNPNYRLEEYSEKLINYIWEKSQKKENYTQFDLNKQIKHISDEQDRYLEINCYKKFPVGIRVKQFIDVIQDWTKEYGSRVKGNEDGIDYKSIYHAYRVLHLAEQLADKGDIDFPINKYQVKYLLDIKKGKCDYKNIVKRLKDRVDIVGDKLRETDKLTKKPNIKLIRNIILNIYKEKGDIGDIKVNSR